MKRQHTPGPWKLSDRTIYATNRSGTNSFRCCVEPSHLPGHDDADTQAANARLIAAAPELLEACKEALYWMNVESCGEEDCVNHLREAIAKAAGGEV